MTNPPEPETTVAPTPAPADAAVPATTVASGAGRGRWLVAFGVAGAAIAAGVVAILLLGARPVPEALRYIPGDAGLVAELRLDLPGDQVQRVGNLLAHFPGFKDQSILGTKLDETLGRIADAATNGQLNYTADIKPWLAGPLFVGARPAADGGSGSGTPGAPGSTHSGPPVVIVATTDTKVSCDTVFREGTPTVQTVGGLQVKVSADGAFACVLDGRYALLGDPDLVAAAIMAHAGHTGMDANATYKTARDALGGDRLATVWASRAAMSAPGGALPSALPGLPLPFSVTPDPSLLPDWIIGGISAEDDALVADLVMAPATQASPAAGSPRATMPPPRASRIAPLLPADTVALVEVHGAGIAATGGIGAIRANPSFAPALGQLDSSLALLGGADALLGWIEDLGVVVVPDGASVTGGVLLVAADDATAAGKADQIRSILSLAGLSGGAQVHDTTIGGVRVTTAEFGDLAALFALTGQDVPIPPGTKLSLSVAARGPAVIVGGGEAFARHLLEPAGGPLTDSAGYKRAIERAGRENTSLVYLGAAPALTLAKGAIPEAERAGFEADIAPYLQPLDAIVITTTIESGRTHVRFVATVK